MSQKEYPSAVSDETRALAKSPTKKSSSIFMPASKVREADGIYSLWPKAKAIASKKEIPTSTAAKGDDDIMSTPSKPARS